MKYSILSLLIITLMIFSACSENTAQSEDESYFELRDHYTFHVNKTRASDLEQNIGEGTGDLFTIEDAWISVSDEKKYLNIEISQEEGCFETYPEKFDVIWSGVTITIYPPQVPLYLQLDTSGCTQLESDVADTLSIDLYGHFQNRSYVDSATFIVVNTSREDDTVKVEQHNQDD